MLGNGPAVKVSIYITDGATHKGQSVQTTLLDFLFQQRVSGATVLKGVAGFGSDHHLHTQASIFTADQLPMKIEFLETRARAEELLPQLSELCGTGMIEMQETTIVKAAGA